MCRPPRRVPKVVSPGFMHCSKEAARDKAAGEENMETLMVTKLNPHPDCQGRVLLVAALLVGGASLNASGEDRIEPALGGHCPVSYLDGALVPGSSEHKFKYIGETYYLSSAEAKKRFVVAPDAFIPQLGGLCALTLGGRHENRLAGDPTVFTIRSTRIYLFSSERAKLLYEEAPMRIIGRAHGLFRVPLLEGYCPVSYQEHKVATKGLEVFRSVYRRHVYHMASAESKALFDKDPERYAPKYGGFCTTNIAGSVRKAGDPQLFRLRRRKTYLFHDKAAAEAFDKKPDQVIKTADARWVMLETT